MFDSIKNDLNSRLLIASKATQAQAEAGSDDTNYSTSLKVKQYCDKNVGVKKTLIALVTGQTTSLDITQYFTSQTEKIEIIVDATTSPSDSGGKLSLVGSTIIHGSGGSAVGDTTRNIGGISNASFIIGKLELYPRMELMQSASNSGFYCFHGRINNDVDEYGTFLNLTSITLPRLLISGNYTNQVAIFQYLK